MRQSAGHPRRAWALLPVVSQLRLLKAPRWGLRNGLRPVVAMGAPTPSTPKPPPLSSWSLASGGVEDADDNEDEEEHEEAEKDAGLVAHEQPGRAARGTCPSPAALKGLARGTIIGGAIASKALQKSSFDQRCPSR